MRAPRKAEAEATAHEYEHYGNIVTYMWFKGIVPPSSEKQPGRWTGEKRSSIAAAVSSSLTV